MPPKYTRVPQSEDGTDENKGHSGGAGKERIERIKEKVHAAFWVGTSIFILYHTDMIGEAVSSQVLNRTSLNLAALCFSFNMCLVFYMVVWLPLVQKVTISIEIYSPSVVPCSAFLSVACIVCLIVAYWPIYGLLTPLIVLFLVLGLLFSTHFIPYLGSSLEKK